jgi:hypothetical protein
MRISKRALVTMLALTTGAVSLAFATGAFGSPGKNHPSHPNRPNHPNHQGQHTGAPLLHESLAPSHVGDPNFHNVGPGAKSWVLKSGDVRLKRDGMLDLRVMGLLIPTIGTGPVTTITASLYCGADSITSPAATSQSVPLSSKGNARIHDASFGVPSTCLAPVILVHPNGDAMHYIAVDGQR